MERETIENIFHKNKVPFFMGGSKRFGYANEKSDTDYFVFARNVDILDSLLSCLRSLNFKMWSKPYGQGKKTVWHLEGLFHVVIHFDQDEYIIRSSNHLAVERLLESKPHLLVVAKRMKQEEGCNGAVIFKYLLSQAQVHFSIEDDDY